MKNNNIREIRTKKKMSVTELAEKSGVSKCYVYFIEAGEKNPSLETAQKISKALETQIDEIFLYRNVL
ncbi:helix-turn-helix transcriptional regulator [Mediterraneibacter agrestimuris]|uniref:helix-turn-helix transcriptional regulator n=1 Tax=Mediterraneibacter agrestimuris TaxID=2941333 RepID=UPI0020406106|nr:helix-turn-helix transcriptional regulator [Mediterraneibacter agrestimuris]